MDVKDLHNQSLNELHRILAESRDELRELKFRSRERQLGSVRRVRALKADVARLLTVINAKRIAAVK